MIWFKYVTHDYMDEKPEIGFRLFKDSDEAKAYEKHMQEHWSGGTTNLAGCAKQSEVLKFIKDNDIVLDSLTRRNVENPDYYETK